MSLFLSLSIYIYMYVYVYIYIYIVRGFAGAAPFAARASCEAKPHGNAKPCRAGATNKIGTPDPN